MPAVEVKENLFWVGAVDWNLRDFHGYALARWGTTYNAFLLKDEKTVLFDTVSSAFCEEFFDNIGQVVDPSQIDYLVVNHVEPDHSGCLVETVHRIKPEKILCSPMGKTFMISHYHRPDWPFEVLKTGDTVSFGRKTARFIELKMLHWPDNMGCYLPEDRLFISSDAFGHNWATSERFDDEVDFGEIRRHMAHYFANIILPFSGNVIKTLEQIESFGWEIETIAPDHGLILRKHPREAIAAYAEWAAQRAKPKAVIVYDTMWESTRKMAHTISEGFVSEGVSVKIFDMKSAHHSDVMADILDAQAVLVGSPTHNNGMLPLMADMLRYMQGLRPQGKIGAAFGSYGWSGEAVGHLCEALEGMKIDVVDSLRVKNVPTAEDIHACRELGRKLAAAVHERQKTHATLSS